MSFRYFGEGNDHNMQKSPYEGLQSESSETAELLSETMVRCWLTDAFSNYKIEIYEKIDSTNNRAKALAEEGEAEPTVILANEQTSGRGRLHRQFSSPPSQGLYMSLLCYPSLSGEKAVFLTTHTAVAVCRAIETVSGISPQIKWVNDIFVQGKKLCGILVESSLRADGTLPYAVIGIGINVSAQKFPPPLDQIAGSIGDFSPVPVSRNRLAAEILKELGDLAGHPPTDEHLQEYRRRSLVIGRTVRVTRGCESFLASVLDIDGDGSLIIETEGDVQTLRAGEVSIRPECESDENMT